jgi:DNA integrity scanning protein DisA with diadenylate cyclase activity
MFESILCQVTDYDPDVLTSLIELAVEIAREGREGRRIGTLFTLGDEQAVLARSRLLILDPLAGHPEAVRRVSDSNLRGTIKELAQLDGAFVVGAGGLFVSACRYLETAGKTVDLPLGLGSRHLAGAAISATTDAVAIVVSESSTVRIFCHGKLMAEIIPELWLLRRHEVQLQGPVTREDIGDLAIVTPRQEMFAGRETSPAK